MLHWHQISHEGLESCLIWSYLCTSSHHLPLFPQQHLCELQPMKILDACYRNLLLSLENLLTKYPFYKMYCGTQRQGFILDDIVNVIDEKRN